MYWTRTTKAQRASVPFEPKLLLKICRVHLLISVCEEEMGEGGRTVAMG